MASRKNNSVQALLTSPHNERGILLAPTIYLPSSIIV